MKKIQILDKTFVPFISQEEIESVIERVAKEIEADNKGKRPLFLVVLNGAFMFAAQLFKTFQDPCEIQFVKYTSYQGTESTNEIKKLIGLPEGLAGRDVIIVEDIIDTGLSMKVLCDDLKKEKVNSIKIATMLFKPNSFRYDYKIDYIGKEIGNDFIVGYGLDYDFYGRNMPEILVVE